MSKIPEGATHQALNGTYRKFVNDLWFGYCDGYWIRVRGELTGEFSPIDKIKADPEWTGERFPPVGKVIEFQKLNAPPKANGEWTRGDVRYLSDSTIVIGGDRCEHVHHPRNLLYRPAKTDEQIAAEKRLHNILNACTDISKTLDRFKNDIPGGGAARAVIEAMIDAGYSKQVEK